MKRSEKMMLWLRRWFGDNGRKTAVLGISGGKDSAVAAGLCRNALGPEQVLGVLMPNGAQSDIEDSRRVVEALGIRHGTANISGAYEAVLACVREVLGEDPSDGAMINIAPRLRMTILYAVAQTLSEREGAGACVVGTGNRGEAEVGYTTKWGDAACDVNPLRDLWVHEVIEVGDELGYVPEIVHKTPADGLSGQTDEARMGFTYDEVYRLLTGGTVDGERRAKIEAMHRASRHKREEIPHFKNH